MWEFLDSAEEIETFREDPIVVQLLCMLGIVVTLVACGYMAFRQGQYIWLMGGGGVIALLSLILWIVSHKEGP